MTTPSDLVYVVTWEGYPPLVCVSLEEATSYSKHRFVYRPYVDYKYRFSQPTISSMSLKTWMASKPKKFEEVREPTQFDIDYDLKRVNTDLESVGMESRLMSYQLLQLHAHGGLTEGPQFPVKGWPGRYWMDAYRSVMAMPEEDRAVVDQLINDALHTAIVLENHPSHSRTEVDLMSLGITLGPLPDLDTTHYHDRVSWMEWAYMAGPLSRARKLLTPYPYHKLSNLHYGTTTKTAS